MDKNLYKRGNIMAKSAAICLYLLLLPLSFSAAATGPLEVARSQVGVREVGHNCGPEVRVYLHYTGFDCGAPWCAAFVSWCFHQAGYDKPRSAWSPAVASGKKVDKSQAKPGHVFAIYYSNLGRIGHVGFIEKVEGNSVHTIEGNTNPMGSREGDGVYRKRRRITQIYKIVQHEDNNCRFRSRADNS